MMTEIVLNFSDMMEVNGGNYSQNNHEQEIFDADCTS